MRHYTANQLDAIGRWTNGFLATLPSKQIAYPVVGRCWPTMGNITRHAERPEIFNHQDAEMANALLVLSDPDKHEAVAAHFDFLGIDYDAIAAQLADQDVRQMTEVGRAARWIYLNKALWWPRIAHGKYGSAGPTNWPKLLDALRQGARRLRGALHVTEGVNDFIRTYDHSDTILVSDLTASYTRKPTKLAEVHHALHVVLAPGISAFTKPAGWYAEAIGGHADARLGWCYSSRPLPRSRQGSLLDVLADNEEREAEARGEVLV